jgi:hypothetical protein
MIHSDVLRAFAKQKGAASVRELFISAARIPGSCDLAAKVDRAQDYPADAQGASLVRAIRLAV